MADQFQHNVVPRYKPRASKCDSEQGISSASLRVEHRLQRLLEFVGLLIILGQDRVSSKPIIMVGSVRGEKQRNFFVDDLVAWIYGFLEEDYYSQYLHHCDRSICSVIRNDLLSSPVGISIQEMVKRWIRLLINSGEYDHRDNLGPVVSEPRCSVDYARNTQQTPGEDAKSVTWSAGNLMVSITIELHDRHGRRNVL